MTKYEFSTPQFSGLISLGYETKNGVSTLVLIDMTAADLSDQHTDALLRIIPLYESDIDAFVAGKAGRKMELIPDKVPSFEEFWTSYAKGNTAFAGAKQKAITAYMKMTDREKLAAMRFLPKYLRHKADTNQNVAYAVTYLNQKTWE